MYKRYLLKYFGALTGFIDRAMNEFQKHQLINCSNTNLTDLPNMTVEKAYQLLDPADKQNVSKAVTLLQSLLQLKDLPSPLNPTANIKQRAIVFVADISSNLSFLWT